MTGDGPRQPGSLRVDNAVVFDGVSEELFEASITIAEGRVVAVGAAEDHAERVIDAAGGVVVPGLIDAHFHAYGTSLDLLELESSRLSYVALCGARRLAAALRFCIGIASAQKLMGRSPPHGLGAWLAVGVG